MQKPTLSINVEGGRKCAFWVNVSSEGQRCVNCACLDKPTAHYQQAGEK